MSICRCVDLQVCHMIPPLQLVGRSALHFHCILDPPCSPAPHFHPSLWLDVCPVFHCDLWCHQINCWICKLKLAQLVDIVQKIYNYLCMRLWETCIAESTVTHETCSTVSTEHVSLLYVSLSITLELLSTFTVYYVRVFQCLMFVWWSLLLC